MIRITIAVALLATRMQLAKRSARLACQGRHWPHTVKLAVA